MAQFNGTLNQNEWNAGLYNAYALVGILADNLSGLDDSLVSMFKTQGGMYRDKLVYTDVDIVSSREWDPSDTNVLAFEERPNVKQQEIVIDKKRQIAITDDRFLTRRAWMDEGSYASYASLIQAQVGNTKRVYEQKLVNVAVGTMKSAGLGQQKTVALVDITDEMTPVEKEAAYRTNAGLLGTELANIYDEVKDSTADFNDNGFIKSFDKSSLVVIWNNAYLNTIQKLELPTVFNKEGIIDFTGKTLLQKYIGENVLSGNANGTTHRAKNEYKIPVTGDAFDAASSTYKIVRAGDVLPSGTPMVAEAENLIVETQDMTLYTVDGRTPKIKTAVQINKNALAYIPDEDVICKIVHREGIKFPSSFETDSEFNNPKAHNRNHYLTWMFAEPTFLEGYPVITVSKA